MLVFTTAESCGAPDAAPILPEQPPTVAAGVNPKCVGPIHPGFTWVTLHVSGSFKRAYIAVTVESNSRNIKPDILFKPGTLPKGQDKLPLPWCMSLHFSPGVWLHIKLFAADPNQVSSNLISCSIKNQSGIEQNIAVGRGSGIGTVECEAIMGI